MKKKVLKKIKRGECLYKGNLENHICSCEKYCPTKKYGSLCKCGHAEIWHRRNTLIQDNILLEREFKSKISPYINSLQKQINILSEEKKFLNNRLHTRNENTEYLCSICMTNKKNTVFLPCRHAQFCLECSKKWTKKKSTCPLCLKSVSGILDILL